MTKDKRKQKKTYRRKKTYKRRKYNTNNVVGGGNTCKIIETMSNVPIMENTSYKKIVAGITGIRAPLVAPNFGLYRIAKVICRFKPDYDTYNAGLPGVGSTPVKVPYLLWKMNRYDDAPPAFNGNYLRTLGSKPIRFDDKIVTIAYKPNILLGNSVNTGSNSGQVKMTPWLSTDNAPSDGGFALSTTEHAGFLLFIEGAATGSGVGQVGSMDVTIIYEFKNPRVVVPVSSTNPDHPEPQTTTQIV